MKSFNSVTLWIGLLLMGFLAILFLREYYRTLGHPFRWDVPTYVEWDCFYNDCKNINSDP